MTLTSKLAAREVDESIFVGGDSHVSLRHVRGYRKTVGPPLFFKVEYVDHIQYTIEGLVAAYDQELLSDFGADSLCSCFRARSTRLPIKFPEPAGGNI